MPSGGPLRPGGLRGFAPWGYAPFFFFIRPSASVRPAGENTALRAEVPSGGFEYFEDLDEEVLMSWVSTWLRAVPTS